jgi:2-iminobutanoate/2-iminopropanoate deaminase
MEKEAISAPDGPKAVGPYSPCIVAGNFVFISGQIPIDPETSEIPEGIEDQTRLTLNNLKAQITAAGCGMDDIMQVQIFTTELGDFPKINEIYGEYFVDPYPTRVTVGAANLPKGVMIEIAAIAIKP